MSAIADEARVIVLIADYIGIDAGNKINALGAGFLMTGLNEQGNTPPQSVIVMIDLPSKYSGHDFALSIELDDGETNEPARVVGPSGQLEPLRVAQVVRADKVHVINGMPVPDTVPVRVQVAMGFPNGLPLVAGRSYCWRVEIDGQHMLGSEATFAVLAPPPRPVFGGPVGPSSIPPL